MSDRTQRTPPLSLPDEQDLVRAVVRGDRPALDRLHALYAQPLYRFTFYRLEGSVTDVEEVVQETFLAALEGLHRFRAKSSLFTWMYRVVLNTATDHLKKRRHDRNNFSLEDSPHLDVEAGDPAPEADISQVELRKQMAEAVGSLPEKYRDILVLREYEGCSYEDIAEILGCSKGTVESRLFRARARLKERLKSYL